MKKRTFESHPLTDSIEQMLQLAKQGKKIRLEQIFHCLPRKGYAILLIVLSFPFCIPIQIPGFSTPFGIILAFIGLRVAFAKKMWWPKWMLDKEVEPTTLEKINLSLLKVVHYLQKIIHPRLLLFAEGQVFITLNGLLVAFLALLLSLPLPVPLSNFLAALPIFFIGLGMLEDDGLMVIVGYIITTVTFSYFFLLYFIGKNLF